MKVKCMDCGSTAQVKQERTIYSGNNAHIFYECGCGTRFVRVYEFVSEFKLEKKKVPNSIYNCDKM